MYIVERKYPQGAVECDVCLFVAKYLDEYLDSNSTIVRLFVCIVYVTLSCIISKLYNLSKIFKY